MIRAIFACALGAAFGINVPAHQYGQVILDAGTHKAGVPAVAFDHWRHRARFTCRLCHVDVGFAMERGATHISASTNRDGFHCGACHNGKTEFEGKAIFAACSGSPTLEESCRRCHGGGSDKSREEHAALQLPRGSFGEVDWEQAEAQGKVRPLDVLAGVSIPRRALKMDRDVRIESHGAWMTDVKFSHKKHAIWNGCEVCHPEIFPSTKAGPVKFTMFQIAEGLACGACHGKVAFPLAYCDRCHTRPVQFP